MAQNRSQNQAFEGGCFNHFSKDYSDRPTPDFLALSPRVITLDGYAASHRAVAQLKEVGTLPRRVRIRSSQYLNNVVEQDHRRIKQRIRPMLGFKRFETAAVTIRGIELGEKIKKNQFNLRPLAKKEVTVPALWTEILAA